MFFCLFDVSRLPCSNYIDVNIKIVSTIDIQAVFILLNCSCSISKVNWYMPKSISPYVGMVSISHLRFVLLVPNWVMKLSNLHFPYSVTHSLLLCLQTEKIVRCRKTNETLDIPKDGLLVSIDRIVHIIMTSERQSTEWSVRALKAPF